MAGYLLDTNIISAELKLDKHVKRKLSILNEQEQKVVFTTINYFEIKRGLVAVNATRKLRLFDNLCKRYEIVGIVVTNDDHFQRIHDIQLENLINDHST